MKFANIIVDISLEKLDRTFQYRVPEELQGILKEGMQVRIPFGNGGRILTGYVLELTDTCEWDEKKLKPILGLAEKGIRLEGQLIALAAWMRRTYGSTMNQALKTVLPVKKSVQEKISRKVRLAVTKEEAEAALAEMERKHQTARVRIIKALLEQTGQDMDYAAAQKELGLTAATARKLMELGLSAGAIHRIGCFAATTLDSLPYSGAILMLLPLCRMKLREVYPPLFITTVVATTCGTAAVIITCALFPGLT